MLDHQILSIAILDVSVGKHSFSFRSLTVYLFIRIYLLKYNKTASFFSPLFIAYITNVQYKQKSKKQ